MLDGTHYFECTCGAPDHTLRFVLDKDEKEWPPTMYTEVMMSHFRPWYSRVWIGIKYMFGMDTPDHYGGWELHSDDADRLIKMLEEFKQGETKYLKEQQLKIHSSKPQPPPGRILKEGETPKRCGWINDNGMYGGYEQGSGDGC